MIDASQQRTVRCRPKPPFAVAGHESIGWLSQDTGNQDQKSQWAPPRRQKANNAQRRIRCGQDGSVRLHQHNGVCVACLRCVVEYPLSNAGVQGGKQKFVLPFVSENPQHRFVAQGAFSVKEENRVAGQFQRHHATKMQPRLRVVSWVYSTSTWAVFLKGAYPQCGHMSGVHKSWSRVALS